MMLFRDYFSLEPRANNEHSLQRQLVRRETHRFTRQLDRNAFHLEQNLARTDDGDPMIGCALAFTHTGFGRLLGDRLVREQTQPDLAATLDEARHGDTGGFDLAVGNVTALQDLEAEVAKRNIGAAPRLAAHAAALLLAVLNFLGKKHDDSFELLMTRKHLRGGTLRQ